jgi:hypothetical protein
MITLFTCTAEDCANKDITYRVEDAPGLVTCGGCGVKLDGVPSE